MRTGRALAAVGLASVLGLSACGPTPKPSPPAEQPIPTVEVSAAPDARATTTTDAVERRRAEAGGFSGVLPEGFPKEVHILRPASLVDVEPGAGGGLAITLDRRQAPAEVEPRYAAMLTAAGWQPVGGAGVASGSWQKGELRLAVEVRDTHPGCRLRLAVSER